MAKVLVSAFKALGSLIFGSLRLILCLACFIWIFIEMVRFTMLDMRSAAELSGIPIKVQTVEYWSLFISVFCSILGCYATFFKNHSCLKLFVGLVIFGLLVQSFQFNETINPESINEDLAQAVRTINDSMIKYSWEDATMNHETKIWNLLQQFGCCGIDSYHDWDQYRPSHLNSSLYPYTCCSRHLSQEIAHETCFEGRVNSRGCRELLMGVNNFRFVLNLLYVLWQFFLIFIASICLCSKCDCGCDGDKPAARLFGGNDEVHYASYGQAVNVLRSNGKSKNEHFSGPPNYAKL